jgi:hypothetical protein
MEAPKRFTAPVGKPIREDPEGNFVYWSDYEALARAFALYMEEGMDSPSDVVDVLRDHLGTDADWIAELLDGHSTDLAEERQKNRKSK